jgi:hypothetical protein
MKSPALRNGKRIQIGRSRIPNTTVGRAERVEGVTTCCICGQGVKMDLPCSHRSREPGVRIGHAHPDCLNLMSVIYAGD